MEEEFPDPAGDESNGWRGRWRRWRSELYHANPVVRQFIHEPLFRAVVLTVLLLGLTVVVMLPKVWDPTPKGYSKSVRVSLLDYLQAWALRRSARQSMADGQWDAALLAWRQAIANNEADPGLHRGFLEMLREAPWARSEHLGFVMYSGQSLIELTGTNRAAVLLLADVLERHRFAEFSVDLLRRYESEFSPEEDRVWMRAMLTSGKVAAFRARWAANPARYESDPILVLYQAAVEAGWGNGAERSAGFTKLREALEDPRRRLVAARMLCAAAGARDDTAEYEHGLQALRSMGSAVVPDDVGWWQLLYRTGRKDEAVAQARAYDRVPPPTAFEMVQLARAWAALGLDQLSVDMLEEHAASFQMSREVWGCFLDLLVQRRDWNSVRRVAARLRAHASHHDELLLVTLYADVRADLAENRRVSARDGLKRLRETTTSNPELVFRVAIGLRQAGELETSATLLERLEPVLAKIPEYWNEVGTSARARRDPVLLKKAADRWVELSPNDPHALALRLTSWLAAREESAEALALSFRLRSAGIATPEMKLLYAQSLLANRRTAEAVQLLPEISPEGLTPMDRNTWWLAQTEALVQSGKPAEALESAGKVEESLLLPAQESWLRQTLVDCRRTAGPAGPTARP